MVPFTTNLNEVVKICTLPIKEGTRFDSKLLDGQD